MESEQNELIACLHLIQLVNLHICRRSPCQTCQLMEVAPKQLKNICIKFVCRFVLFTEVFNILSRVCSVNEANEYESNSSTIHSICQ